jgi:hypothetical protein
VRFESDAVIGGGLVYQDLPVHVNLFHNEGAQGTTQVRMARASMRRDFHRQTAEPGTTSPNMPAEGESTQHVEE